MIFNSFKDLPFLSHPSCENIAIKLYTPVIQSIQWYLSKNVPKMKISIFTYIFHTLQECHEDYKQWCSTLNTENEIQGQDISGRTLCDPLHVNSSRFWFRAELLFGVYDVIP